MVDGSNESLYHANEEFDPNLCTGVPLQKSFEKVDVWMITLTSPDFPPLKTQFFPLQKSVFSLQNSDFFLKTQIFPSKLREFWPKLRFSEFQSTTDAPKIP